MTEKKPENISCSLFGAELRLIALSIRKRFTIEQSEAKHCLNLQEEMDKTSQIYTMIWSWGSTWLCEVSRALWRDTKIGYLFYVDVGFTSSDITDTVLKSCVKKKTNSVSTLKNSMLFF